MPLFEKILTNLNIKGNLSNFISETSTDRYQMYLCLKMIYRALSNIIEHNRQCFGKLTQVPTSCFDELYIFYYLLLY